MAKIVEVPRSARAHKYVNEAELEHVASLLRDYPDEFIGEIIEPLDTQVKARYAKTQWCEALRDFDLDTRARVYEVAPNQFTFALKLKPVVEDSAPTVEEDAKPARRKKAEDAA